MELSDRNQIQNIYGQNNFSIAGNQFDQKLQQAELKLFNWHLSWAAKLEELSK